MRIALIENGVVVNIILAGDGYAAPDGLLAVETEEAGIEWRYNGGTFSPPAATPVAPGVPESVALWQARAILAQQGLLDNANAAVAASDDPVLKAVWEYGNHISRSSPGLIALGATLGMSDAQIDALFVAAGALVA